MAKFYNYNYKFYNYLIQFSHRVVPPKSVGSGVGGSRGGGGGRVVYHTSAGQYIGVATFFFKLG